MTNEANTPNISEQEQAWKRVYRQNKGAFLILLAEAVASSMDAIVRFLQQGGRGIHPYQIIFARMAGTTILSTIYMWWNQVPDFPLGKPSVRGLLVIRALFGFFGLWCLYYSVRFLPLAEATVFRFLVPIVTGWACSIFLGQVFSGKDLCAGLIALIGVIIIAQPAAIFGPKNDLVDSSDLLFLATSGNKIDQVTPAQRLFAIAVSLLGVLGASGAYTMIRVIGDRAHALISVNYFAIVSTVGSTLILLLTPNIGFKLPQDVREWALLASLGVLGFILQFLLTAGLQLDRGTKATSMMYSQIIFALLFDWGIWGMFPGTWSIIGGFIVIASTLWSALQKHQEPKIKSSETSAVDEESALLGENRESDSD
ncbi:uncharacterized protein PV09_03188 [Verruconis gallopava]|uniref:EamA domain-containing protein n=1 Tax=Verruconis gallopava TaxID=253628 RepID=A0A0D1YZB4_9PEZI|nr:uncharacterized protein PV09_03188 [Verruconis gallopava]KIW06007.1 hypothetical protein PV09_03188 [Verruconis gallopava]